MVPSVILFLCALIPVLWAIYPMGLGVGAAVICLFLLGLVLRKPGLLCLAFFSFVGFAIYTLALGHFVLAVISVLLGLSAWDMGNLSIWSKKQTPKARDFPHKPYILGLGSGGRAICDSRQKPHSVSFLALAFPPWGHSLAHPLASEESMGMRSERPRRSRVSRVGPRSSQPRMR